MAIEVVNRQRLVRIDASRVALIVGATLGAIGRSGSGLTVAFVRDRVMRDLNRKFRGADHSTDVLSFPAESERRDAGDDNAKESSDPDYLGDIAVSTDTAQRQAREAGHSFQREVDELVIHGVVHLCGYDHETDNGEMNKLELKLRRKLLDSR